MRVSTFYDINCDKCGRWASSDWSTGFFDSKKICLLWAKNNGWKTVKGETQCIGCILEIKILNVLGKRYSSFEIKFYPDERTYLIYGDGIVSNEISPILNKIGLVHKWGSTFEIVMK